jgi:NAD(P)H-dependent flavin oxidoreductase YrpB (nitropropane dioxygenase family)
MMLSATLENRLRLPAIAAPMFLTSGPDLVVEVCRSGVLGTFPALKQKTSEGLSEWLSIIEEYKVIKRGISVAATITMAANKVSARNPALLCKRHHNFDRLEVDFTDGVVVRNIFVQVSCGSIMAVDVPVGMTEAQVLAEFRKGQFVMALTALLIGTPFLFALTFMR